MITREKKISLVFGIPGLVLNIGCMTLSQALAAKTGIYSAARPEWIAPLVAAGSLTSVLLLIVGLRHFARAKGYSDAFGFLGLLSLLGIVIMAALPDKTRAQTVCSEPGDDVSVDHQ